MINRLFIPVLFLSILSFQSKTEINQDETRSSNYSIDLTKNMDTLFVRVEVLGQLDKSEGLFQFPVTAPGTYQTMNIGRFVSGFQAYDKKGRSLEVSYLAPNQYLITKPQKLAYVEYAIAETFDTPVKEWPIYLMCGSSLEADHALINAHAVMGYFVALQAQPMRVRFERPDFWKVGTALKLDNGWYKAETYDYLVDSPLLMGDLSYEDTTVAGTDIRIFTYSASERVFAKELMKDMSDMLDASRKFLIELPVDRYTFLFLFAPDLKGITGAWEHSYSSEYVLNEGNPTPEFLSNVTDIASHEFFHIVTPLNIHSEIIERFNFEVPTPSKHLWLYEGVTEWASNILLLRAELVDLDTYLKHAVAQKIQVDQLYFKKSWSLEKIAMESYTEAGAQQYGNIYHRGSLVAGLLDIRLLDLSEGQYGLRELVLDLAAEYGPGNPVSEDGFIDKIVEMTYPEIGDFFNQYVWQSNPLPYDEYFNKIGLDYGKNGKFVTLKKGRELSDRQKMLFDAWSRNLDRDRP